MNSRPLLLIIFFCTIFCSLSLSPFAWAQDNPEGIETAENVAKETSTEKSAFEVSKISDSLENYDVAVDKTQSRFNLGFYTALTSFKRESASFSGTAFELLAGYALNEKVIVGFNMLQAIDFAVGISVLATALRSSVSYAILGQAFKEGSVLKVNGEPAVYYGSGQSSTLSADMGFDQVFFNGQARVTPATGLSAGLRFDHALWLFRMSWMVRYGALVISDETMVMTNMGVGMLFRF